MKTPHSSFISPFRTGGDPCTFREAGELQAEIGNLRIRRGRMWTGAG